MSVPQIEWDQPLIEKYNYSGPRYTSYPTALEFDQRYTEQDFCRRPVAIRNVRCLSISISRSAIDYVISVGAISRSPGKGIKRISIWIRWKLRS